MTLEARRAVSSEECEPDELEEVLLSATDSVFHDVDFLGKQRVP